MQIQVKNGEISKTYGVISEGDLNKEVNLISWNGRKEKIDIRGWDDAHTKCGKGIALSFEEAKSLRDILNGMEL
jgi:hypothetical protein